MTRAQLCLRQEDLYQTSAIAPKCGARIGKQTVTRTLAIRLYPERMGVSAALSGSNRPEAIIMKYQASEVACATTKFNSLTAITMFMIANWKEEHWIKQFLKWILMTQKLAFYYTNQFLATRSGQNKYQWYLFHKRAMYRKQPSLKGEIHAHHYQENTYNEQLKLSNTKNQRQLPGKIVNTENHHGWAEGRS